MEKVRANAAWIVFLIIMCVSVSSGSSALGACLLEETTAPSAIVKAAVGSAVLSAVLVPLAVIFWNDILVALVIAWCGVLGQCLGAAILQRSVTAIDFCGAAVGFILVIFAVVLMTVLMAMCPTPTCVFRTPSVSRDTAVQTPLPLPPELPQRESVTYKLACQPNGEVLVAFVQDV